MEYDDLVDRTLVLPRRRGRGPIITTGPAGAHVTPGAPRVPYQEVLRALGWELDDGSAYNVLIEQVNTTYCVSYMALDRSEGFIWRKRGTQLGPSELESVRKDAQSRRQPPPLLRRVKRE